MKTRATRPTLTPAAPAPTARRLRTRVALLRAAVSSFNRHGFHQTSLEDIGEKLGITKGALYYYIPNKSALLAACFDCAMEIARECLARAIKEKTTGRERLVYYMQLYIERTNEELHDCVLLTEDYALDAPYREGLIRERDVIEHKLRKLVRDGIRDGSIAPCDPKLAVVLLLGAVNWLPKWFSPAGAWNYRQLAQAVAAMLDRMLSPEPAAPLPTDVRRIAV